MARKTKDLEKETNLIEKKSIENKQSTKSNKNTIKPKTSSAKAKTSTKKEATKTSSKSNKSTDTKTTAKKTTAKKSTKKTTSKKTNTSTRKKSRSKIKIKNAPKFFKVKYKSSRRLIRNVFRTEYYDLPFSYNKTVVKILAQTPTTLFVYWELSEKDANDFRKKYGDNFFDITKPILVLYNDTKNYVYEIEINDFANSWYIHVNDSKCDYHVELGRKPISTLHNSNNNFSNNINANSSENSVYIPYYVYITSSNEMILPNDKILFNPETNSKIAFRNIKTGVVRERNIGEFKFITNYGIFTIQELYKYLYPNENFEYEEFLRNPSSGLRSSMSSR